ncbi:hypothetical protein [Jeotgalibacillus sp. R-1-5s-1]|uniref:hypothetical protein n=1 Tax=Jeotgalibacillus sp. R-1-5s-1 TaxID=2555897 RepID=UPI00106AEEA9|nr:hypothetical protein [Jeotgalibacillus sp. R-1-5s-1]TFD97031.1 hypothetical protein E2491_10060 [Jeotgalibacillus sp. R-1-5s-1]
MGQESYHLSVRYKDFEYTVSGDRAYVDEHHQEIKSYLSKLMRDELQPKSTRGLERISSTFEIEKQSPAPKPLPTADPANKPDIQRYLEELPLHSEWQFTLAMAYYLFQHKLQPSFTAKTVRKQFREARHTVPNNIHLSVHTCVKKGYLQESGQADLQKTYEITESGIAYIQALQNSSAEVKASGDHAAVENVKQAPERTIEDFNLENNPDPRRLERIEDQALSILYIYRKEFDVEHLSARDVHEVLSQHFNTEHSAKAIQIALSRSRPLVEKIKFEGQMHYRLTKKGLDHMETLLGKQV